MGTEQGKWQGHLIAAETSGMGLSTSGGEARHQRAPVVRGAALYSQSEGGQGAANIGIRVGQTQSPTVGQGHADGASRRGPHGQTCDASAPGQWRGAELDV